MKNPDYRAQAVAKLEVDLFRDLQQGLEAVYAASERPENDNPAQYLLHRLHRLLWTHGVSNIDPERPASIVWKRHSVDEGGFRDYGKTEYRYSISNPLPRPSLHYVLHMVAMRVPDEFEMTCKMQGRGQFRDDPERWINWFEYLLARCIGDQPQDPVLLRSLGLV